MTLMPSFLSSPPSCSAHDVDVDARRVSRINYHRLGFHHITAFSSSRWIGLPGYGRSKQRTGTHDIPDWSAERDINSIRSSAQQPFARPTARKYRVSGFSNSCLARPKTSGLYRPARDQRKLHNLVKPWVLSPKSNQHGDPARRREGFRGGETNLTSGCRNSPPMPLPWEDGLLLWETWDPVGAEWDAPSHLAGCCLVMADQTPASAPRDGVGPVHAQFAPFDMSDTGGSSNPKHRARVLSRAENFEAAILRSLNRKATAEFQNAMLPTWA